MPDSVSLPAPDRRDATVAEVVGLPVGPGAGSPSYEELYAGLDQRTREVLRRRARSGRRRSRESRIRRALAVSDLAALAVAWSASALLTDVGRPHQLLEALLLFVMSLPVWLALGHAYGLHDADVRQTGRTTADDAAGLFHLVVVGAVLLYVGVQLTGLDVAPAAIGVFCALAIPALVAARAGARTVMRRRAIYHQNAIVVGAGSTGRLVASKLEEGCRGINVVGFVDSRPGPLSHEPLGARYLGNLESLPTIVRLLDVERVIVAFSSDSESRLTALVRRLDDAGIQVDIVPRLFDALGPRAQLHELCGLPLMGLPPLRLSDGAAATKRLLDIAGSAVLLLLLTPLLAGIALALKLTSPGPVLYRGARIGRNGVPFLLLKFRTMRIEHCRGAEYGGQSAEAAFRELMSDPARQLEFERTHKLASDPRVTRIGALLRRTSLDELPQLFNVVRGDLALVGPRPVTADEFEELPAPAGTAGGYWTIPDLRPGVTGYWQVNGRSSTSYEERVRLDAAYASSWSFRLDLRILAKTGSTLLDRRHAC
jgi:exopolysaccharide biosynthesis polyprenyl glycosylphosphotransferase